MSVTPSSSPHVKIKRHRSWTFDGVVVLRGTHVDIDDEAGRFTFLAYCTQGGLEWVDVYGGEAEREAFRLIHPDRVHPAEQR